MDTTNASGNKWRFDTVEELTEEALVELATMLSVLLAANVSLSCAFLNVKKSQQDTNKEVFKESIMSCAYNTNGCTEE